MPLIKFCGITRVEDARLAAELGAWAIGFIFAPTSPRFVDPVLAQRIAAQAPVQKIGVFVNQSKREILRLAILVGLDLVQLHGEESIEDCIELRRHLPVIKAIRVRSQDDLTQIADYENHVDMISLDSSAGGSGKTFDWNYNVPKVNQLMISGGLTPANVGQAVKRFHPYAVDVASGVEVRPGIKDPLSMRAFLAEVHHA